MYTIHHCRAVWNIHKKIRKYYEIVAETNFRSEINHFEVRDFKIKIHKYGNLYTKIFK